MTPHFMELAATILDVCRQKGLRIATAESCTGGLLTAALTAIAGSSDVVECGYVTYSNSAKMKMLAVSAAILAEHGAVSEQVATAMSAGARLQANVQLAISVTGVAGPGSSEAKPEGMVCFAIAKRDALILSETVQFGALGRTQIRDKAVEHALHMLLTAARSA